MGIEDKVADQTSKACATCFGRCEIVDEYAVCKRCYQYGGNGTSCPCRIMVTCPDCEGEGTQTLARIEDKVAHSVVLTHVLQAARSHGWARERMLVEMVRAMADREQELMDTLAQELKAQPAPTIKTRG